MPSVDGTNQQIVTVDFLHKYIRCQDCDKVNIQSNVICVVRYHWNICDSPDPPKNGVLQILLQLHWWFNHNLVDWWVRADLTETENRNPSEVAKAHWPLPVGSFILPAGCSAGLPSAVNRCSMKKHAKPWPRSMWRWGIVNGGQWWFNGACWACLVGARVWSVSRISSQTNHDMNFAKCRWLKKWLQ